MKDIWVGGPELVKKSANKLTNFSGKKPRQLSAKSWTKYLMCTHNFSLILIYSMQNFSVDKEYLYAKRSTLNNGGNQRKL